VKILICICARGGSKGIPGKNIKKLNGIPLIAYSIYAAKRFSEKYDTDIALSTDDDEIKSIAVQFGLYSNYSRPSVIATDSAGKIDVIKDLLVYQELQAQHSYDYILDLDVTSPLRTLEDLESAFVLIQNDANALNLFSVNKAARNPYFNMVEKKPDGYFGLVKSGAEVMSRQSAPEVYDLNASFYFYKRNFFEHGWRTVFTEHSLIYLMPHICFDLDHLKDFEFLDFLLSENKIEFEIWK
jgi:CMP-N,N'-diacetyllegionaminic acid synthase